MDLNACAAKAVCLRRPYQRILKNTKNVINNTKIHRKIKQKGFKIFSGGTDMHNVDRFKILWCDWKDARFRKANITCNKNGIPFDTEKYGVGMG